MISLESGASNSSLPDASHPSESGQKRLASLAFDPFVLLTPLGSLDISLRGLLPMSPERSAGRMLEC